MFWIVVGLGFIMMVGMYCGFSSLSSNQDFLKVAEVREVVEYETFLEEFPDCNSLNLVDAQGFMGESPPKIVKSQRDLKILKRDFVQENLIETVIEGTLDGQLITFWTRERIEDRDNIDTAPIIVFYLRGSGPFTDFTKETSLLGRPEFTLIIPYILGDPTIISDTWNNYSYSSTTFQTYILTKISRLVDYVEVVYDSPQIIVYGEAWGSVLARELAIVDERIDLVITNKFPGDPYRTIDENGFYSTQALTSRLYIKDTNGCIPSSVGSFGRLVPTSHVYLGPSTANQFYGLGTEELAEIIEDRYESAGFSERFSYIELEDLDSTNIEEVIGHVNKALNSN